MMISAGPARAAACIDRYVDVDGVLDFVFCEGLPDHSLATHHAAARLGLEEALRRAQHPRVVPAGYPSASQPVTWAEFLPPFRHAVLEPPYNLGVAQGGLSASEKDALFVELCAALLPKGSDSVVVAHDTSPCTPSCTNRRKRSSCACGYFDAGSEWWGTFFWTVSHPDAPHMLVILGSATD